MHTNREIAREIQEALEPVIQRAIRTNPDLRRIRIRLDARYPKKDIPLQILILRAADSGRWWLDSETIDALIVLAGLIGAMWLFAKYFL